MVMKKIALLLIFCGIIISGAGAYIITPTAPDTINVGVPLVVNGTSNLPAGVTTRITLSEVGSMRILAERQFTIQGDGSFTATFNTSSLGTGTYKLELVKNNDYDYGSGSTLWLFVNVIDRRSELAITSPLTQTFDGSLEVRGAITTISDRGIKVQVIQGNTTIYGPEYVSTTSAGGFDVSVPITAGGMYVVTLTDSTNYPWFVTYTVLSPTPTTGIATTTTEAPIARQVTQPASRSHPAYFQVESNRGELIVSTSSGVDWVVDYIDETGSVKKVNTRGTSSEEVRLSTNGGAIYFKVYPDRFEEQANVTLSVQNARSISVCTTCAAMFGDVATTTEAPLPAFLALGALGLLVIARRRS
ncbi:MAG: hypothetical protein LUQ17_02775 [Methanomicrobiales archaeon]|nr:hypothetical protein [Methanomicrobiales archaeon]